MRDREEQLVDLLMAVNRGLHEYLRETFRGQVLPFAAMIVMRQVKHQPGITVSELARQTGLAKSHVSKTLEELTQLGYVEKRPDPADQRLLQVYLTEQAIAHLHQVRNAVRRQVAALVAALPDPQVAQLVEGLETLQGVLERARQERKAP